MKSVISILAMLLVMGTTTLRAAESDGIPAKAPKADLNTKQMKKIEEGIYEIPESKGILLTHIPAGEFIMGSPESKIGRRTDEVQHKVKITKPFYMGVKEITQAQYMSAMHPDHQELAWKSAAWGHHIPSFFVGGPWSVELTNVKSPLSSERPMEMLTWDEAISFTKWLNKREAAAGRLPKGYIYRLPTEAEWEYACRAGSSGAFGVKGDRKEFLFYNSAWSSSIPNPFGRRKPNPWGLYDMHGSVYEWVIDWYGPYNKKERSDPVGPKSGKERVMRGGSVVSMLEESGEWKASEADLVRSIRSASRNHLPQDFELPITGMRLVLAPGS